MVRVFFFQFILGFISFNHGLPNKMSSPIMLVHSKSMLSRYVPIFIKAYFNIPWEAFNYPLAISTNCYSLNDYTYNPYFHTNLLDTKFAWAPLSIIILTLWFHINPWKIKRGAPTLFCRSYGLFSTRHLGMPYS